MTDTNESYNFTRQFAANGHRGTAAIFATDGIDSSDLKMGGVTFANFDVDANLRVQERTGVMPAALWRGASAFAKALTQLSTNQFHRIAFEFVRDSAFSARTLFDYMSAADERRIPLLLEV